MIHHYSIFTLILLVPILTSAQQVYTWEDDLGVVHFSDSPNGKNIKVLTLPDHRASAPAPSFENIPTTATSQKSTENRKPLLKPEPLSLSFQSPTNEQTIRSNQGHITVASNSNRKLTVGEHLQLVLNDTPYAAPNSNGKWQLKNINRGSHTISIQAFRDGKLIASSHTITVHLHRASTK